MLNELSYGRKVRALLIGFALTFCSMFIGRGYNPLFAVISLVEPAVSITALGAYILFATLRCGISWLHDGAALSLVSFQVIMMIMGYLPLLTLPLFRKFIKDKRFVTGLGITILSSVWYWWSSNSLCFTQMSGLIPSWTYYEFSFSGYLTCLIMGGSFFWHSLIVSVPTFCLFYLLSYFRILFFNESLSFSRQYGASA